MPRSAQDLGGLVSVISEVAGRSAKPMRRTVTHRPPSMPPLTTPFCHTWKRAGSVT